MSSDDYHAKAFLANRGTCIRLYIGNPDRYEFWADGACQGESGSYDDCLEAMNDYFDKLGSVAQPSSRGLPS